eukprot:CAMPEP_0172195238 /NCGR_PEP_ID=MMETSP1050-20130122/26081_1 /TAXON_ID=233186 /ORGANISM="Cryptomonas curvata, Strain CCAP979/52" /LENGTH=152 /DNA_ID=CAMNT_0012871247 /DNA_START=91 /DNA_END=546 /DNA_ORIENTATION=-
MGQQGLIGMRVFPNTAQPIGNNSDQESSEVQGRLERSPTALATAFGTEDFVQPSGPMYRRLIRDLDSGATARPKKREISGRALAALAEASTQPSPFMDPILPARPGYPKFKRLDRDPLTGLCLVPPIPMQHACNAAAAHSSSHPPYSTHLPH